jgi:hypothetical protein
MLYRQLIGSLMYLVNTKLDICFVVNTLNQFMVDSRAKERALDNNKTCSQVFEGHNGLWSEISWRW